MTGENVLITSAGRRVSLMRMFQAELKSFFSSAKVFTTDFNPNWSAACCLSDQSFKVPKVHDSSYVESLLDICKKNQIGLVIPTIDTELQVLSDFSSYFEENQIQVIISDSKFIRFCRDKRLTIKLFNDLNITVPKTIDRFNPEFPVFIKPFNGSLSNGIKILYTQEHLTSDILEDDSLMFMEYIYGKSISEYTVDLFYCKQGKLKCAVPRQRVEVRGGEISKGKTVKNYLYYYLVERLKELPGAKGCITMQFFFDSFNNNVYGIEINPRFGGGFPLTYAAGANYVRWIIEEYLLLANPVFYDGWVEDKVMIRYDSEYFLDGTGFA